MANQGGSSCRLRYPYGRILMCRSSAVYPGEPKTVLRPGGCWRLRRSMTVRHAPRRPRSAASIIRDWVLRQAIAGAKQTLSRELRAMGYRWRSLSLDGLPGDLPFRRASGPRALKRDAEFLEDPLRQIDQPPAHHAMDRRDRATLDHAGDGLTLEVIELGRFTRRLAVQESVRPASVEAQHPVPDDLKPNAADLGRLG